MRAFFAKIPAHVRYPGMILGLLICSSAAQFILLRMALSGDGLQVEPDYYNRALGWEQTQQMRALGWRVAVQEVISGDAPGVVHVKAKITGGDGEPLAGVSGTVEGLRPHLAEAQFLRPLLVKPSSPAGEVTFIAPMPERGLWDLRFVLSAPGHDAIEVITRYDHAEEVAAHE